MEKLKERITENGIDYILVGDYYIPDLKLPEESRRGSDRGTESKGAMGVGSEDEQHPESGGGNSQG